MNILGFVREKKEKIREATPAAFARQRIADGAAKLNRAGMMAARVEILNEALTRVAMMVYERDADGVLANVDRMTHRLLIPAPWGIQGYRQWGLREWEARAMSKILRARQEAGKRPTLFFFERPVWYVNLSDYPTSEAAQWWLQKSAITLAEWRLVAESKGR